MNRKSIVNRLELAYAPLTAYEFALLKDDPFIAKAIEQASLYVIAQRPVITFENVIPERFEDALSFEIHQKGNPNILKGKLPLIQASLGSEGDNIAIALKFLDKEKPQTVSPFNNLHAISFAKQIEGKSKFLLSFSPEKLLQNWWKEQIECDIEGSYESFLNYKVQYVGKATRQSIFKRLRGHNKLQDILSLENPITYKDSPAHEIVILCFEFKSNVQFQVFSNNVSAKELGASLLGENFPNEEKIFLDAEKALINAIKPKYCKELYNNYPKSIDGLFDDKYNSISYTFVDPITLQYKEGEINGKLDFNGGDSIVIKDNKDVSLVKMAHIK